MYIPVRLHLNLRLTWRTHSVQVARKTANHLYQLRPLLCSSFMSYRLGKFIVFTYAAPIVVYSIPVWSCLTKTRNCNLQCLLDRGLPWAFIAHYSTPNKTIRESFRVCSLNATIRAQKISPALCSHA